MDASQELQRLRTENTLQRLALEQVNLKVGGLFACIGHGMEIGQTIWEEAFEALDQVCNVIYHTPPLDTAAVAWMPAQDVALTGWYWMDFKMPTPIFPCYWTGNRWESSSGIEINVQQFYRDGAEILGPIVPSIPAERDRKNDQ